MINPKIQKIMQEELENLLSEQISDDPFAALYAVDGDVDIENPALASTAARELSKYYSAEQIAKMHHDQNVKALKRLQEPQQFGGDFKSTAPLGVQDKDLDVDFAVGTPPPTFPGGSAAPKSLELHWAKERRKLFSKISRAKKFAAKYGYEFNMPKKWNISYSANRTLPQGEVEIAGNWELDLTATDPTKGIKFIPHYKSGTIPKKTRIDVYGGEDEAAWEKVRRPGVSDWAKYWGEKTGIDPRTLSSMQWGGLGPLFPNERPAVVPRTYQDPRTGKRQTVNVVDVSQAPEYQPWGVTPKQLSQTGESGIEPEQVSMTYGDIIASDPGRVEAIKRAYDKRQKFKGAGRYMSPEETGLIPDIGMPMEWPYEWGMTDIFYALGMPDMEEKMNNQAAQQFFKKDYDELDWLQKKELQESEELRNVQARWFGDPYEGSMGGLAGSYKSEVGLEAPGADYQMGALDLFDIAMVPLWGAAAARAGRGGYRALRAAPRATKTQFIRAVNNMARNYMHWRYRGGKLPGQELHPHFQTFRSSAFPKGRRMLPPKGGTTPTALQPLRTTPSGIIDPKQLRAPPPGPDPSLPHKGTTHIRESYEKSKFNKIVQEEYKKLIKKELEGHKKLLNEVLPTKPPIIRPRPITPRIQPDPGLAARLAAYAGAAMGAPPPAALRPTRMPTPRMPTSAPRTTTPVPGLTLPTITAPTTQSGIIDPGTRPAQDQKMAMRFFEREAEILGPLEQTIPPQPPAGSSLEDKINHAADLIRTGQGNPAEIIHSLSVNDPEVYKKILDTEYGYSSTYEREEHGKKGIERTQKKYFGPDPNDCMDLLDQARNLGGANAFRDCMDSKGFTSISGRPIRQDPTGGQGAFRMTYSVPDHPNLILKVAKPENWPDVPHPEPAAPRYMNWAGARGKYQTASPLVPKTFAADPQFRYTIEERIVPIPIAAEQSGKVFNATVRGLTRDEVEWEEMLEFFPTLQRTGFGKNPDGSTWSYHELKHTFISLLQYAHRIPSGEEMQKGYPGDVRLPHMAPGTVDFIADIHEQMGWPDPNTHAEAEAYVQKINEILSDPMLMQIKDLLWSTHAPVWDIRPDNVGYVIRDGKKQLVIIDPGFGLNISHPSYREYGGRSSPFKVFDPDNPLKIKDI